MTLQIANKSLNHMRMISNIPKMHPRKCIQKLYSTYAFTVDVVDALTNELLQKQRAKTNNNIFTYNDLKVRYITDTDTSKDVSKMTTKELDEKLLQLVSTNKDKQIAQVVLDCWNFRKYINEATLKKLFRNYSLAGKPEMIVILQKYCSKVDYNLYKRNGEFFHYLAKAECLKGNSEKGLSILKDSYKRNEGLRPFYRIIFRELIHDSVLHRSEASLVVFKKYVMEFSKTWSDHYPLICYWHICWSSTWFSDQMLANELLESSKALQEIVRDKATAFSISILRQEHNEDAVLRLLQSLLKYDMMMEYVKVLQVLFSYKLKNRDIRGCTEILRNCDALGVSLTPDQQGKYIEMLIKGPQLDSKTTTPSRSKDFKLKF